VNFSNVTGTMDASDNISASFKAAARGRIVDYADAPPELRSDMESAMFAIDRNPESMEAIQAYGRSAQERLDDVIREMSLIRGRSPSSVQALRQTMIEAEKLGLNRVEATRELSMVLGATKEVLRRFNEEYIPEAEKAFAADSDPESELYPRNVMRRKEDFINRITELEAAHFDSTNAAISLRDRMEEWEAIRASGALETKIVVFSQPLRLKTTH
jgi:hypothetical protein